MSTTPSRAGQRQRNLSGGLAKAGLTGSGRHTAARRLWSARARRLNTVPQRLPDLLHERSFRRFWIAETISLFGDQISLLALPLVGVLVLHASATEMGMCSSGSRNSARGWA